MDEMIGEETPGAGEVLDENETPGTDDAESSEVLGDSVLDIFESEASEDETLRGLADGLEEVNVLELVEHCYTVLEQFEMRR